MPVLFEMLRDSLEVLFLLQENTLLALTLASPRCPASINQQCTGVTGRPDLQPMCISAASPGRSMLPKSHFCTLVALVMVWWRGSLPRQVYRIMPSRWEVSPRQTEVQSHLLGCSIFAEENRGVWPCLLFTGQASF